MFVINAAEGGRAGTAGLTGDHLMAGLSSLSMEDTVPGEVENALLLEFGLSSESLN